jgi:chromosomal replication initiator protein
METNQKYDSLWTEVCNELSKTITSTHYGAWLSTHKLKDLQPFGENSIKVVFSTPSAFHALKFEQLLGEKIINILQKKLNKKVDLKFKVYKKKKEKQPREKQIDKEDLFSQKVIKSISIDKALIKAKNLGIKSDFNFKTFAVSSTNEMAHAAALSVAENPGANYNPLFLYGRVGVGKTHLVHAIAHKIIKKDSDSKVIYCSGEEFTNEIIGAIRNRQALEFKQKYRHCDLLLIDDIQFIAGKNAVQEEFFHTFNALVGRNSQIVLTSDRPPDEISLLESRLKSRFEAGLVVDIQQPSFELRTAILLIKANNQNLNISMEQAQIIASRVTSARQIEGVIIKIKLALQISQKNLNDELIQNILKTEKKRPQNNKRISPGDIIKQVGNHFKIKPVVLRGTQRMKEIVLPRHLAMYILKTHLDISYAEIGKWFSHRDHTSVMHAVKKISKKLDTDHEIQNLYNNITQTLGLTK